MDIRSDNAEIVDERAQAIITTPPVAAGAATAPAGFVTAAEVTPAVNPVIAPAVAHQVVDAPSLGTETRLASRTSSFVPSALVAGVVAIALLVLGGITAARAGVDSTLDDPVVTVAGFTATALLGLIEIAFGLVLLMAALARARSLILFLGITGGVAALVAVFQPSVGEGSLALERGFAVFAAIVMAVLIAAALLPTLTRRNVVQRTSDVA